MHPLGEAGVASPQLVFRLLDRCLLHLLHEQVVFDPLPPGILRLGLVRGPGRVFAIGYDRLRLREIERCLEEPVDEGQPRIDPLEESVEHLVGEAHVTPLDQIVKQVAFLPEGVDVALEKVDLHRIERLDEDVEPAMGDLVVDRSAEKVLSLEIAAHGQRDLPIIRPGRRSAGGHRLRGDRCRLLSHRHPAGRDRQREGSEPGEGGDARRARAGGRMAPDDLHGG